MSPADASRKAGHRSSTDTYRLCLVPPHDVIGIAGYPHSRQASVTVANDGIKSSVNDAKVATARKFQENVIFQFHMNSSAWDVIHKEVMDWRDSSWTSMHLPGDTMCMLCPTSFVIEKRSK